MEKKIKDISSESSSQEKGIFPFIKIKHIQTTIHVQRV
jgi:hypothetical protein